MAPGSVAVFKGATEMFAFTAPGTGVVFPLTGHAIQDAQTRETQRRFL